MTVVYLDTFLLINVIMNFLLLLASGKLAGERIRTWRIFLAASFGAAYAACSFFPGLSFSVHPFYKISVAILMLLISFGRTRSLLRISIIFLAISCSFCGAILGIEWLKGSSYMNDGIVYSSVDVKGLLMSAVFCYGVLSLFFRRAAIHHLQEGELVHVQFELDGRTIELTALQDSGNTLQDPISGQSIPVAEGMCLASLFPPEFSLRREALERPIETIQQWSGLSSRIRFRLLPYRAVGVDCGMLLAVRMDRVILQGECLRNQLVALSPTPVSDGGSYSVLIGVQSKARKGEPVKV